jgi:uncharacterized protein
MTKPDKLRQILSRMQSVVVAYSGGLDSTFLLAVALKILGAKNVLAVNALSETYPAAEACAAQKLAKKLGARLVKIKSGELQNPRFVANPKDRCYHCKKELFLRLWAVAKRHHILQVVDGSNLDDELDYRPGSRAAKELGVRSPLKEAGFTKDEIRRFSRKMKLPTWDKPSYACLASRFPYGTRITRDILCRLDAGESFLRKLGFRQVRARHHGNLMRIEVGKDELPRLGRPRVSGLVVKKFKQLGYTFVTLDLAGYRTGSMNESFSRRFKPCST